MSSYSEYYRNRLETRILLQDLVKSPNIATSNIIGKKRSYEEAMGYSNDYLVVQEPEKIKNKDTNRMDAYLENLSNEKNKLN